jgi:hypothetical protein
MPGFCHPGGMDCADGARDGGPYRQPVGEIITGGGPVYGRDGAGPGSPPKLGGVRGAVHIVSGEEGDLDFERRAFEPE